MRCLDKRPEARFQSASDLAFALESTSGTSPSGLDAGATNARPRTRHSWLLLGAAGLAAGAVVGALAEAHFASPAIEAKGPTFIELARPSGADIVEAWFPRLLGRRSPHGVSRRRTEG
jgi:hypothetical protein